ncbi:hypothetical protein FQN49_003740 [Arthroderma sp. PD_2]|nr:hypothetical protein FQN49_003740 [Arthroderma sp. PD_2]
MAVHPTLNASPAAGSTTTAAQALTPQQVLAISSWSEQAIESLSLESSPIPYRNSAPLTIPLDDHDVQQPVSPTPVRLRRSVRVADDAVAAVTAEPSTYRRREPLRRDSLKRRESLLKGKEGSRRRQRWENDRLLSNPWAQPPSANDWQVQPTYPRHNPMPYYLATLWDSHKAAKEQARRRSKRKQGTSNKTDAGSAKTANANAELDKISKELRTKLKHARAARGLVQELEEEIRLFVQEWIDTQTWHQARERESDDSDDSVDEDGRDEVVFTGRKMQQSTPRPTSRSQATSTFTSGEKMVFESPAEDRAAGFGRWLVHSLASYYGLRTWSVTVGNPPRREAYVGIDELSQNMISAASRKITDKKPDGILPRPLWVSM